MPLLQDQFQAADRLEYMGLGSSGIKSNILFPKRLIKTDTAVKKKYGGIRDDQIFLKTKKFNEICKMKVNHTGSISSHQDFKDDNNDNNKDNDNDNDNDEKKVEKEKDIHHINSPYKVNSASCYKSSSSSGPMSAASHFSCSDSTLNSDLTVDFVSDIEEMERLVGLAIIHLEKRLRFVSNPLHRLRCGCYGREMREDVKENGLNNAAAVIMDVLEKGIARIEEEKKKKEREKEKEMEKEMEIDRRNDLTGRVVSDEIRGKGFDEDEENRKKLLRKYNKREMIYENEVVEVDFSSDNWHVFDCGVNIAIHHTAPEESQFLYDEIFVSRIYLQHGLIIKEGDLVIDVGESKTKLLAYVLNARNLLGQKVAPSPTGILWGQGNPFGGPGVSTCKDNILSVK